MKHHPERKVSYHCAICNYSTKFKPCLTQHLNTQKHKKALEKEIKTNYDINKSPNNNIYHDKEIFL